jgi:hypothetical protein
MKQGKQIKTYRGIEVKVPVRVGTIKAKAENINHEAGKFAFNHE